MELLRNQIKVSIPHDRGGAERALWLAAMHQAYLDYWSGDPDLQADAICWILEFGGMFEAVCVLFGIHPEKGRALIFERQPTKKKSGFALKPFYRTTPRVATHR